MRIVLIGKMGTGKDTVADYLVQHHGFAKYAFATKLKQAAVLLWPEKFTDGKKDRKLLQRLGDLLRIVDPGVFAQGTIREIEADGHPNVVITDCRRRNELDACLRANPGFVPVQVVCDSEERIRRLVARDGHAPTHAERNHITETELGNIKFGIRIDNSGTFEELYEKIEDQVLGRAAWLEKGENENA